MDVVTDTTFLVGLWRRQPWALGLAERQGGASVGIPWVVLAEFWQGATRAGHPPELVERFLALGVPIVDATPVIPVYARLATELQSAPEWRAIGQNDLWIASTALAHGAPLVTRSRRHFDRIPGLRLVVGASD